MSLCLYWPIEEKEITKKATEHDNTINTQKTKIKSGSDVEAKRFDNVL